MRTRILVGGLVSCMLVLAGCGGGSDDTGTPPPPPPPPPPPTATYTIGGTVNGLASGASLVLQNNGGSNVTVNANGAFTFAAPVNSGSAYAVTVPTQPTGQTCSITNGSGTATANVSGIVVNCVTNVVTHTLGGTVSGLASGASLILQNGDASTTVSADGAFTFAAPVNSGSAYAVTVATQPAGQTCNVTNGSGTATANVSDITVNCVTNIITVTLGGTVSGLASGASLVLQNGDASVTINADGAFTFAAPVNSGSAYAVTVATQPVGQTCNVTNGSGTATANVSDIVVNCLTNDTTAPAITSYTPLATATGAAVTGGVVTVTFSEAMDAASLTTSSLTLSGPSGPVAGTVSLDSGNTRAIFTPASRLSFEADYTATVTTAVKDAAGNALGTQASWKFNTGKSLALGMLFTCARLPDGRVKCWGDNTYGQLGYDDVVVRGNHPVTNPTQSLAAVNLGAGRTAVALVAADYHACAILDDGTAKCWGRNDYGQLGQGVASVAIGDAPGEMAALQPIDFGAGRRVLEISLGQQFTCARLDDATVKCWGDNSRAQLGRGNLLPLGVAPGDIAAAQPVALGTGLTPVLISLGHYHACAILEDAAAARVAKCWGDNNWGQVGNGHTDRVGNEPGEMGDGLPAVNFGAGRSPQFLMATGGHSCARLDDLSTKCWGLNTWGQVGLAAGNDTPLTDTEIPRRSCNGGGGTSAPTRPLACIGEQPGEMGDALPPAIPATQTARLSIGYRHNCVLRTSADMVCWGSNEEAQLGNGSGGVLQTSASIIGDELNEMGMQPLTLLKAGRTVEELSGGGFHTCVLYTDGNINCWGNNNRGQLGRNDAEFKVGDSALEMGEGLIDINLGT